MRHDAPRSLTVLGATGSIGASTLDLVGRAPERFRVEALTANSSAEELAKAARAVGAKLAVVADPAAYGVLKQALSGSGIEAAAGAEAVVEAAERPSDFVMSAIVGAAGLAPTLTAVRRGAVIGLANKETLVCAGALFKDEVRKAGATLLPVDSEHNAIFQVLDRERPEGVEKIILTASGGPFRSWQRSDMAGVTPEQAVAHPNWSMGAKISVEFGDHDEQGPGGDRGGLPLRPAAREDRSPGSSAVGRAFDGRLHRRVGAGATGRTRHAHPDRL